MAVRLAAAGKQVIVVESGRDAFDADIHGLNELDDTSGRYKGGLAGRFRGLGGSSSRWGGGMIPLARHDIGARPYLSLPAWPIAMSELDSYQAEIGRLFGLDQSSFEEDLLDQVDRRRLFPRLDQDFSCRWVKWLPPKRRSVARLLKREIEGLENLQIWLGATVVGFELDAETGRLSSVQAGDLGGRQLTVSANEFILAAGAIESTRLLLLLDRISNGRAFERCSVLGRYFQDHLDAEVGQLRPVDRETTARLFGTHYAAGMRRSLHLELTGEAQSNGIVASAFAHITGDLLEHSTLGWVSMKLHGGKERAGGWTWDQVRALMRDRGDIARTAYWRVVKRQLFYPEGVVPRLRVCVEQVPDWNNQISLSGDLDRLGVPKARVIWRPGEVEERTFRACIDKLGAYWRRAGLERICPIEWHPTSTDRSQSITDRALDWAHPSGTTRMGTDPETSVVNADLRCHHVPNVSVVSASTFPTAGSSNPTLTIMQIAMRFADRILGRSVPRMTENPRHHPGLGGLDPSILRPRSVGSGF